jgi:hypothetical protein
MPARGGEPWGKSATSQIAFITSSNTGAAATSRQAAATPKQNTRIRTTFEEKSLSFFTSSNWRRFLQDSAVEEGTKVFYVQDKVRRNKFSIFTCSSCRSSIGKSLALDIITTLENNNRNNISQKQL